MTGAEFHAWQEAMNLHGTNENVEARVMLTRGARAAYRSGLTSQEWYTGAPRWALIELGAIEVGLVMTHVWLREATR